MNVNFPLVCDESVRHAGPPLLLWARRGLSVDAGQILPLCPDGRQVLSMSSWPYVVSRAGMDIAIAVAINLLISQRCVEVKKEPISRFPDTQPSSHPAGLKEVRVGCRY